MKFNEMLNGTIFMFNGTKYVKNSKATAKLLENNRVFYFTKNEVIQVVLGTIV